MNIKNKQTNLWLFHWICIPKIPLSRWKKSRQVFDPKGQVLLLKLDSFSGMMFEVRTFIYYSVSAYKMPMTCQHHLGPEVPRRPDEAIQSRHLGSLTM